MSPNQAFDLRAKFRAASRALRASYEADSLGAGHSGEKGLRRESVLAQFLTRHLPPCYGVARGEVVAANGAASKQVDLVVYDALHAPLLQTAEASRVFPAESVYAAIELKDYLNCEALAKGVANIASVKRLDRSAVVEQHGGHRMSPAQRRNPPIFGAVFALDGSDAAQTLMPALAECHRNLPAEMWLDCVCVLDQALLYHFAYLVNAQGQSMWMPSVMDADTRLGHLSLGEDTLFFFYLFLLYQLNVQNLFPPDLMRYARGGPLPQPTMYRGAPPQP